MATCVNYHRIASDCYPGNTCDINGSLPSYRADADRIGFASNTFITDIDIEITCGEVRTGEYAQCNIVAAACVVIERKRTVACVRDAGCIVSERTGPRRCIVPGGCIAIECKSTIGRVLDAGCIIEQRDVTIGCV